MAITVVSLIGATVGAYATPAMAAPEQAIGRWSTPTKHGVVEIAPCGPSICGRLVESDSIRANPAFADGNNKNAALRSRPLKGLTILQGFTRSNDGWQGGSIYNPEDGGTYKATITIADPDTLKLKGCIVWPLCKTQTWKRLR
ncbi:uncharacterized protein (DUF2147 family) [Novosphingobium sp. SG720]|nr:uncharacterized protein (DUF2147 family) [Novosphingobium sp. SG720]